MSESIYGGIADDIARSQGIPPALFRALIKQESDWQPQVVGAAQDTGLTQLTPPISNKYRVDPLDPIQNMQGGAAFVADQFKRYGNWRDALSHYNAGFNLKAGRRYADSILSNAGIPTPGDLVKEISGASFTPVLDGIKAGKPVRELIGEAGKTGNTSGGRSVFDPTISGAFQSLIPDSPFDTKIKDYLVKGGLWVVAIFLLILGLIRLVKGGV